MQIQHLCDPSAASQSPARRTTTLTLLHPWYAAKQGRGYPYRAHEGEGNSDGGESAHCSCMLWKRCSCETWAFDLMHVARANLGTEASATHGKLPLQSSSKSGCIRWHEDVACTQSELTV